MPAASPARLRAGHKCYMVLRRVGAIIVGDTNEFWLACAPCHVHATPRCSERICKAATSVRAGSGKPSHLTPNLLGVRQECTDSELGESRRLAEPDERRAAACGTALVHTLADMIATRTAKTRLRRSEWLRSRPRASASVLPARCAVHAGSNEPNSQRNFRRGAD